MSRAFAVHAPPPGFCDERAENDAPGPLPPLAALALARPFLRARIAAMAAEAERAMTHLTNQDDDALRAALRDRGAALRGRRAGRATIAEALALAAETARRTLALEPGRETLAAAAAVLSGAVAETGGRADPALAAALVAAVAASAGIPVHIVAPGAALAAADQARFAPLYRRLGLDSAQIDAALLPKARRAAYRAAIVHASARQLALDYLRDRLAMGANHGPLHRRIERLGGAAARRLALRGLRFAIVTEADAVLIDGAFSPVSIAASAAESEEARCAHEAVALADALSPGVDFVTEGEDGAPALTERGRARLAALVRERHPLWAAPARREDWVADALAARRSLRRGEHYTIADGRLELAPGHGLAPLRARRLRQLLEVCEGLPVTALNDPLARLTYQQFFRRYLRLAGVSATAREAASAFRALYRLPVIAANATPPPPIERRVFAAAAAREAHLVARIERLRAADGFAVVCLRRAETAERLAERIAAAGVEARLLTSRDLARRSDRAAQTRPLIVHVPGREAAILLTRFLAGATVDALIVAEPYDDRRTARALIQGLRVSGAIECLATLDDELMAAACSAFLGRIAARAAVRNLPFASSLAFRALARHQRRIERVQAQHRRDRRRVEAQWTNALAFSGPSE